ncbi:MAG: 5-formyltetrahydrofolate cyclo-ligase [Alphaproteobacteria bacterium]
MNDLVENRDARAVYRWRRMLRRRMVARRKAITGNARTKATARIESALKEVFSMTDCRTVALYWPIRGEVDLRPFARSDLVHRFALGLPYVPVRCQPVLFRQWHPGAAMEQGFWNIPVPRDETCLRPDILLIPLVGFDEKGYRLGNGGGYYDRTLARMDRSTLKIGIGFEETHLPTIHPQWHDIPMDIVITEQGARVWS